MSAVTRLWCRLEEALVAFLLAVMTLITFVYVVVNNSTRPHFEMARATTLSVLGRAMSAAIKAQLQDALALSGAFGRREGLDLQVAEIDGRFTATAPGPFDQRYMQALYAHGEKLGRAGDAFTGQAGPGGQGEPQTLARR